MKSALITFVNRTETDIATFPCANWTDVNAAVKAARSAFDSVWRHMSGTDRGKLLTNLSELLDQHKQYLGKVESLDTGKSIVRELNLLEFIIEID